MKETCFIVFIFLNLLSWRAAGFTTIANGIDEEYTACKDNRFAVERDYLRGLEAKGVLILPEDAMLVERTLNSLSLFVNWSNAANEQLAGLQVNSSNNLRVGSQELIQLVNSFRQELMVFKNYWDSATDLGNLEGLSDRINALQQKTNLLISTTGFLKSNKLLEFHDYAIDRHQFISQQLKNAQEKSTYHRQQEQVNRSRAATSDRRTKGSYLFLAMQEGHEADYQQSLMNSLTPKVDNGKKLLEMLVLMQNVIPDFQRLLSATGSNLVSVQSDAEYIQTNSSTTNTAYRDLRTNRLKTTMAELFELIG